MTRGGSFGWNTVYICSPWDRQWGGDPDAREPFTGVRVARDGSGGLGGPPTADDDQEAFVALFNGKDFTGLTAGNGDLSNWNIENGALISRKGHNRLFTAMEFREFILRFEFQIGENTMSSVGFWAFPGDVPAWVFLDNTRNAMAAVTWRNQDGAFNVSRLTPPARLRPEGIWNEMEIPSR